MVPDIQFQSVILWVFFFFLRKVNVGHYSYDPSLMLACSARSLSTLFISESKCLLYKEGKTSPVGKLAQCLVLPHPQCQAQNMVLSVWVIFTAGTLNYLQLSLSGTRGNTPFSMPQFILWNVLRRKKKGVNYGCVQESETEQSSVKKPGCLSLAIVEGGLRDLPGQQTSGRLEIALFSEASAKWFPN